MTPKACSRRIGISLGLSMLMLSSQAPAGGLYIGEFGQPNMGAANAGAQAIAEDASTAG